MSDCNHVWKVPLYGPTDTIRCEKCGVNGQGYEIANNLERQLAELREAAQRVFDAKFKKDLDRAHIALSALLGEKYE